MSDADSITRFAARHRLLAAAVLVQVASDEDAPAASRVAASTAILGYSDGRPSITRHVTARDVVAMPKEVRNSLWRALFDVEDEFPDFVVDRINDTMQREARRLTTAKTNRFTRGQPEPRPPHVPPPHVPPPRERKADGAPKPPADAPHRQPRPPPSPEPSPLPPAAKGNGALNGHTFSPANFTNADYDAAGRPLRKIGYGEPSPGLGITTMTPGATGATGRGRG